MISAAETEEEPARLLALQDLEILDTPPEARFDQVTRLAALLFDVPIALVSLVDADRQWFKSCIGLNVSETGRDVAFCAHAIHSPSIMVVPDAALDERFQDNPLVTDAPFIRFYAGRPLRALDGQLVGTLCIIDTKPREFSADDHMRLESLGQWVELEMQNRALGDTKTIAKAARRHEFWALSKDLLCVAGQDGFFKDISPSFSKILGRPSQELLEQPFMAIIHPDDVASTMAELERQRDGEATKSFRARFEHQDGSYRTLEWTAVPRGRLMFAVARDVTDEVRSERRLARVIERLQDSTRELRDFTGMVAHDLRGPLRRLRQQPLEPAVAEQLDQMDAMVQALVEYERLFLAEFAATTVDLGDVWAEVMDLVKDDLVDVEVSIEGALGTTVGDHDQMAIVLRNLVENSIKFKHPDRPLQIRLRGSVERTAVEIDYQDNGQGIPAGKMERLWQPFQGVAPQPGAHGMGMPTIKRIMNRHGGDIVAKEPEEGARFVLTFPREASDE